MLSMGFGVFSRLGLYPILFSPNLNCDCILYSSVIIYVVAVSFTYQPSTEVPELPLPFGTQIIPQMQRQSNTDVSVSLPSL